MKSLEEIQSLNHHMRLALDQVTEGVLVVEAESHTPIGPRIVFANRAVTRFSGYEVPDMIGQPLGLLLDRNFLPVFLDRLQEIGEKGEPFEAEKSMHLQGGEQRAFRWTFLPVKDSLGRTINFTIRLIDVEKKEETKNGEALHEHLAKSRLESLQIVSHGIAHDFRNGLVATKLAIDLVRMHSSDPEVLQYLDDANQSLDANAELATQMLEFARGEDSTMKVINLHGLLHKTARMSTVGNNVTPELSIQPDLWDVEIDSVQIRQVFQNIIINGCQAMPNGGPMHISARNATVAEANAFQIPRGNYVVIGIRDRGCGIPKSILNKVFDPYFTTKKDGTGIGLASCKQIVERHKGKIMVESAENVGTEFIIFLPAALAERGKENAERPVHQAHARVTREFLEAKREVPADGVRKRRVLVVDDDPLILKLASKMIFLLGMEAVAVEDSEEALARIRQAFRDVMPFSVVIIDLNLPRLSGLDLMREIRRIDENVKVVLSSGDSMAEVTRSREWDGVLSKPYGKEAMEQVLTAVLQGAAHHSVPNYG